MKFRRIKFWAWHNAKGPVEKEGYAVDLPFGLNGVVHPMITDDLCDIDVQRYDNWAVSEISTGKQICSNLQCYNRTKAVMEARKILEKIGEKAVKEAIKKAGEIAPSGRELKTKN